MEDNVVHVHTTDLVLLIGGWLLVGFLSALWARSQQDYSCEDDNKFTIGEWTLYTVCGPLMLFAAISQLKFWKRKL